VHRAGDHFSQCRVQQNQEQVKVCTEGYMCVSGDDRCFPKECFDGAMTKDEDSIDCGGSCRPCHCFNGLLDAGETGIDCEGGCKPCLGNYSRDMTAPNVAISSPLDNRLRQPEDRPQLRHRRAGRVVRLFSEREAEYHYPAQWDYLCGRREEYCGAVLQR